WGEGAKHALFASSIAGMLVAGGFVGWLAAWRAWSAARVAGVVLTVSAIVGVAFAVAVGAGVYGAVNVGFAASLIISLAITAAIFLVSLLALSGQLLKVQQIDDSFGESRRALIEKTVVGVVGIVF